MELVKQDLSIGRRKKAKLVEGSTSAWRQAKDLYEIARLVGPASGYQMNVENCKP